MLIPNRGRNDHPTTIRPNVRNTKDKLISARYPIIVFITLRVNNLNMLIVEITVVRSSLSIYGWQYPKLILKYVIPNPATRKIPITINIMEVAKYKQINPIPVPRQDMNSTVF